MVALVKPMDMCGYCISCMHEHHVRVGLIALLIGDGVGGG